MGRPPIGKTAMTDAERMRRNRAKHATKKPVAKPVTKSVTAEATEVERLGAENAVLRQQRPREVADLRRQPAAKPRHAPPHSESVQRWIVGIIVLTILGLYLS